MSENINEVGRASRLLCECCVEAEASHWMDWGEWLCSECAGQALEDDLEDDAPSLPLRQGGGK